MMEEQEFKELLNDNVEGPSYGFSTKTMRKIEAYEASKPSFVRSGSRSIIAYIIPIVFLVLIITTLFINDSSLINFNISLPDFKTVWLKVNLHISWILGSLGLTAGFWAWIWWEKKNFRFR
ncbi:hypothetical protein QYS48_11940 [Marivirga arenosa]|jgi:hypothetical protein|uniref:Uncharacterized protein n=1 Tax=Marivirga arenosa TaxID=3059076 RepID=A0AA49GGM1_9BACT|nr:hypothetical protein [Marivirga sp. ABR2-2]WKK87383.2 hypothetical protein QYS48_11940 [Marivirga sp. ABR2-2]